MILIGIGLIRMSSILVLVEIIRERISLVRSDCQMFEEVGFVKRRLKSQVKIRVNHREKMVIYTVKYTSYTVLLNSTLHYGFLLHYYLELQL